MLRLGGVQTVILTGFAADNCVLFTAADAYMREFRLIVPRDAVGARTTDARRRALATMHELFDARTPVASALRLSGRT
jgi:nicotinamidase-related amidase